MLVLTRKAGEELLIGEDIVITVLEVRGDGVKIGIDAPRHVKVSRREIVLQVADTNQKAATTASPEAAEALKALLAAVQRQSTSPGGRPENGAYRENGRPQAEGP